MPRAVVHGETHRPFWVGGSDPATPIGYYEYKIYPDVGHPVAATDPTLAIVVIGDGQWIIEIPEDLDGARLVKCHAFVTTPGGSGPVSVMLRRIRTGALDADMLTTPIVIASGDLSSYDSGSAAIDPLNAEVLTADQVATDVIAADGEAAGLGVTFVVATV